MKSRQVFLFPAAALILGILLLPGCQGPDKIVRAVPLPDTDRETVKIRASNFDFDPDVIKTGQGTTLVLKVENTSGTTHNITVKNPEGEILAGRDIPAYQAVDLELSFPEKGIYYFYCDKPFHPTLGMKGRIEIQ